MATDDPLLCSSCSMLGEPLWRSRARLYPTYIELSGWSWTGRTVYRLPIETIQHVRWWGGKRDINLEITLASGKIVALYLEESAGTWNYTLRRLREENMIASEGDASADAVRDAQSTAPATDPDRSADPSPSGDTLPERTAPHRVGIAPS
ncbi:hypothetical protein [Longimonas halophila]|nr:hypothetical protein [Longimonas halophila]